ncbi:hypothetical protein ACWDUD_25225 [Rhodococcus sp. NPDC003382]
MDLTDPTSDPRDVLFAFNKEIWKNRSFKTALSFADPVLRLCLAQNWLHPILDVVRSEGFDPDEVAEALANLDDSHPLWSSFERVQMKGLDAWPDLSTNDWAVGGHDRPVTADVEELWLYDRRGKTGSLIQGNGDPYIPFLLKYGPGGWKILNIWSSIVPSPGWPPKLR